MEYNSSFVTIVLYSLAIAVAGVISYFTGKYLLGDMYNGCIRELIYIISGFCAIVISILAFGFVVFGIGIILVYVLTFIFKQKAIMSYTKLPLTY